MKQYGICTCTYYNGCIPITVYVVQKRIDSFLCHKWVTVKGYDDKDKAVNLYNLPKEM